MFNWLFGRKAALTPALPPTWQPAVGSARDREGFAVPDMDADEYLAGDKYGISLFHQRGPRPIWLPDLRAEKNRQAAAERARRSAVGAPRGGSSGSDDLGPSPGSVSLRWPSTRAWNGS
jgi:hypothetical protein